MNPAAYPRRCLGLSPCAALWLKALAIAALDALVDVYDLIRGNDSAVDHATGGRAGPISTVGYHRQKAGSPMQWLNVPKSQLRVCDNSNVLVISTEH
jgi:hypothetical protein